MFNAENVLSIREFNSHTYALKARIYTQAPIIDEFFAH